MSSVVQNHAVVILRFIDGGVDPVQADAVEFQRLPLCKNPETSIEDHPILTPLAPAIAFPLANPPVVPQPKDNVRYKAAH